MTPRSLCNRREGKHNHRWADAMFQLWMGQRVLVPWRFDALSAEQPRIYRPRARSDHGQGGAENG